MSSEQPVILIVEDNLDNAFVTSELIRRRVPVFYVDSLMTGYSLFEWLQSYPQFTPDLILMDIQIPGEDGYAVLRRVRADPRLKQAWVAALTANVLPANVTRAREAGFDGFIGKPIDPFRFPEQVKRLLAQEAVWEPR